MVEIKNVIIESTKKNIDLKHKNCIIPYATTDEDDSNKIYNNDADEVVYQSLGKHKDKWNKAAKKFIAKQNKITVCCKKAIPLFAKKGTYYLFNKPYELSDYTYIRFKIPRKYIVKDNNYITLIDLDIINKNITPGDDYNLKWCCINENKTAINYLDKGLVIDASNYDDIIINGVLLLEVNTNRNIIVKINEDFNYPLDIFSTIHLMYENNGQFIPGSKWIKLNETLRPIYTNPLPEVTIGEIPSINNNYIFFKQYVNNSAYKAYSSIGYVDYVDEYGNIIDYNGDIKCHQNIKTFYPYNRHIDSTRGTLINQPNRLFLVKRCKKIGNRGRYIYTQGVKVKLNSNGVVTKIIK